MPTEKLSPKRLANLSPPETGVDEYLDTLSRGLALRVFPSGRASWTFRYRTKGGGARRRISLGEYPNVNLTEARRRADRVRGEVSGGADPQGALTAKRQAPTLAEIVRRYLAEEIKPKKKPRTLELYTHYLDGLVLPRLGSKKAHEITPAQVDSLHRKIGADTPVTANRVVVTLSGVYSFAARRQLVPPNLNPARGIEKFKEQSRERYLTNAELGRLGNALRAAETAGLPWIDSGSAPNKHERKLENRKTVFPQHITAAFRLLLFTGCRLREILHLRWSEVDIGRGLLLLPDSKTGRKSVILNAPAQQLLAELVKLEKFGEFVIPGDTPDKPRSDLKRPWDLVREFADLKDVRIHDLRHTHASFGAGAGLGLPIIGKLLGHKHSDTTAKYAHLDADPLRRASNRIGSDLAHALSGKSTKSKTLAIR